MERQPLLWSDLDGCLLDFMQTLYNRTDNLKGTPFRKDWYDKDVVDAYDEIKTDLEFWKTIPLYTLVEANYNYIDDYVSGYLTKRPAITEEHNEYVMDLHGFTGKVITTQGFKVPILKEHGVTHFIEDNASTWEACNNNGITCYLVRRPWNSEHHNNELAVDDVLEAIEKYKADCVRFSLASSNTEARKDDQSKIRFDLIPINFLTEFANVFEYGAEKYDEWNWTNNISQRRVMNALLRHAFALASGEDEDPESGFHHAAHIACNCAMLYATQQNGSDTDDRTKRFGTPDFTYEKKCSI